MHKSVLRPTPSSPTRQAVLRLERAKASSRALGERKLSRAGDAMTVSYVKDAPRTAPAASSGTGFACPAGDEATGLDGVHHHDDVDPDANRLRS